jgi:hypothetical protein
VFGGASTAAHLSLSLNELNNQATVAYLINLTYGKMHLSKFNSLVERSLEVSPDITKFEYKQLSGIVKQCYRRFRGSFCLIWA